MNGTFSPHRLAQSPKRDKYLRDRDNILNNILPVVVLLDTEGSCCKAKHFMGDFEKYF